MARVRVGMTVLRPRDGAKRTPCRYATSNDPSARISSSMTRLAVRSTLP